MVVFSLPTTIFLSEIMSLNCIQLSMSKKPFHLEQLACADAIHVSWRVCMLCHRAHHVLSSLPHPPGHHLGWTLSYITIMKWAFKGPEIASKMARRCEPDTPL